MSRTYRIKPNKGRWNGWNTPDRIYREFRYMEDSWSYQVVWIDRHSKEGKKRYARYHMDKVDKFKEPGPSWFRNLFSQRPYRRHCKVELKKFLLNPDYEPDVPRRWKLDYWT